MAESLTKPLPLINSGALSFVFIGAGSAFSKKYFQTNLLVIKGDTHLLIDCGTRAPEALFNLGLTVTHVQNYLITHSHADHIGGLEEVMLVNRYGPRKKPNIIISENFEELLWNSSLKGGSAYNENHNGKNLEFKDFWNIIRPIPIANMDREFSEATIGSLNIKIFRTKHIPDNAATWKESCISYGVIIDNTVLFSGDTRFDPELIAEIEKSFPIKTIFHDCQLFTGGVHASIDELSSLPESTKKKMYLVHYQDSADTQIEKAKNAGFAGFIEQWKMY